MSHHSKRTALPQHASQVTRPAPKSAAHEGSLGPPALALLQVQFFSRGADRVIARIVDERHILERFTKEFARSVLGQALVLLSAVEVQNTAKEFVGTVLGTVLAEQEQVTVEKFANDFACGVINRGIHHVHGTAILSYEHAVDHFANYFTRNVLDRAQKSEASRMAADVDDSNAFAAGKKSTFKLVNESKDNTALQVSVCLTMTPDCLAVIFLVPLCEG